MKEIKSTYSGMKNEKHVAVTSTGIRISTSDKPVSIHFEQKKGTVFLLLDCSSSMSGYKLDQAKQGIKKFAMDAISKNYKVGLIKFDTNAYMVCSPDSNSMIIVNSMDKFEANGTTNMVDALEMAYKYLIKYQTPLAIVIATDGMPDDEGSCLRIANKIKKNEIAIITIGTDDANKDFLSNLASSNNLSSIVPKENLANAIASAALLLNEPNNKRF